MEKKQKIIAISCIDDEKGIGFKGHLLNNIPNDMKFFKNKTMNNIVVMGRKTFESMGNKPLPNRINIVITSSLKENTESLFFVKTVNDAISLAETLQDKDLYVIGGYSIYKEFLPLCDELFLTQVSNIKEADTYFPSFEDIFEKSFFIERGEYNGIAYSINKWERIK